MPPLFLAARDRPQGVPRAASQAEARPRTAPRGGAARGGHRSDARGRAPLRRSGSRSRQRARDPFPGTPRGPLAPHRSRPRLRRDRGGDGLDIAKSEERDPPRAAAPPRRARHVSRGCPMSDHVTFEELDALCSGELPPELGTQVEDHARRCPSCGRELAWLRAERGLVARRAAKTPALDESIWRKIEERAYAPIPLRRGRQTLVGAIVAVSAAAALAVIVRPAPPRVVGLGGPDAALQAETAGPPAPAALALDRAEGDYRSALTVLEAEYARSREKLDPRTQQRWDRAVSRARVQLADAAPASRAAAARPSRPRAAD